MYTFEGCTGSHSVNVDDAVIASDAEVFSLVNEKRDGNIIQPGFCRVLDIKIKADNPDTIRVIIPSMVMENTMGQSMEHGLGEQMKKGSQMSPRAQMKHGIASGDVQCREGFELVMKNSDGSAACINSHSVEKLIQRGWASQF